MLDASRPALAPGIIIGGSAALMKLVENGVLILVPATGSVAAIIWIWGHGLTWLDASSFLLFYLLCGIGAGLGMHRYFTHRSFETNLAIRTILAALATMCFQGTVLRWVIDHRRHHAHADHEGDVHSPHVDPWGFEREGLSGLLYAHIGWMFDLTTTDPHVFGDDLLADPMVMFFARPHVLWLCLSLALPYAYGYILGGPIAASSSMLIGGCLRTTFLHNVVWAVNSIGHSHGSEDFRQSNRSKNNFTLAILTLGDGWHNNHHRFPRSAFHGLRASEIDLNGWIIAGLESAGLVWNVVRIPAKRVDAARTGGAHV